MASFVYQSENASESCFLLLTRAVVIIITGLQEPKGIEF